MAHNFREPEILEIARAEGKVVVEDLAARFNVSVQTIRRDLADLADRGRLKRVHGGAVLPSGVANIGYEHRRGLNDDAKDRIALRCAEAIPNGASLLLNIGTSTEAVARRLLHHKDLLVLTNNLNIANILAANPACQVMVAGGMLRRSDGGLVGDITSQTIGHFKLDMAVIGCSAIDGDGDLLDFDVQEVGVSKAIIRRSRRTYLVADSSKFHRTAPARIASLAEIDCFFTDRPLSPDLTKRCAEWETEVVISPPPAASG